MINVLKTTFFAISFLLAFNIYGQDCDLRCQMESMSGNKSAKKSTNVPKPNYRNSSSKPLIYDKNEVQNFLDEFSYYFIGEEFIKVGSVSGDLDSYNIGNIKMVVDGETFVEIKEISLTDNDRLGFFNKRPSSVEDLVSYDYYSDFYENGGNYSNFEFNIDGISFSADLAEDLFYDVPYLKNLGLLDNINILTEQNSDFRNANAEFLIDMNDQVKFSVKVKMPKTAIDYSSGFMEEVFEVFSYAIYEGSCESDYEKMLDDYGMTEDDYPMPAFIFEFFECLIFGFEYIDDDILDSTLDTLERNANLSFTGKTSYDLSWSTEVWNAASIASGGAIDMGLLTAKGFLANKMSKFELVQLLDGFGIPYEYKGLFDDLVYEYYSDFYNEAKSFVNYPRGIGFSIEVLNPIDPNVLENLEDNPMLFFNLLNNIRFDIYANPSI